MTDIFKFINYLVSDLNLIFYPILLLGYLIFGFTKIKIIGSMMYIDKELSKNSINISINSLGSIKYLLRATYMRTWLPIEILFHTAVISLITVIFSNILIRMVTDSNYSCIIITVILMVIFPILITPEKYNVIKQYFKQDDDYKNDSLTRIRKYVISVVFLCPIGVSLIFIFVLNMDPNFKPGEILDPETYSIIKSYAFTLSTLMGIYMHCMYFLNSKMLVSYLKIFFEKSNKINDETRKGILGVNESGISEDVIKRAKIIFNITFYVKPVSYVCFKVNKKVYIYIKVFKYEDLVELK
ncbi:Uncharacterised protein [Anaerobiospirillum thomasii]|uniref:hypothetical protein n=1 Tax=Anaerobiospirillum thomasii TaxID=179995 RepID=UPI000D92C7A6|nr:hypothetical protein [Anaerobiospirillum thomasii]SPT71116.1 Uncharacterised protein [Anaerobiospirillum thomasii]